MKKNPNSELVMFTLCFPYGNGEAFIEDEIKELSAVFERILIVPSDCKGPARNLPTNVEVCNDLVNINKELTIASVIKNLIPVLWIYAYTLLHSSQRWNYLRHYKSFFHFLVMDIGKLKKVRSLILQRGLQNFIFYDYWFVNTTLCLCVLKIWGLIKTAICRAHRFDLYDELQMEGNVSFREFKMRHLDAVYTVSSHGFNYLCAASGRFREKVKISRLGVRIPDVVPPKKVGQIFLIVSCSRLIPSKNVVALADSLKHLTVPVRWVHFGDGAQGPELERRVAGFPPHVYAEIMGDVPKQSIIKFYEESFVDLFVSLSDSEGLPVSMMEAISFGIPVLAKPVAGVPEIVNKITGELLDPVANESTVGKRIEALLVNNRFDRARIREFHARYFDATNNYREFSTRLSEHSWQA